MNLDCSVEKFSLLQVNSITLLMRRGKKKSTKMGKVEAY